MKKILFLLLIVTGSSLRAQQKAGDLGKISLSVSVPAAMEGLQPDQITRLETKLVQVLTASGVVSSPAKSKFSIVPTFTVVESNVVEGGLAKITSTKTELGLLLKQTDNGAVFASFTKSITGTGNSVLLSINNAISKISSSDASFKQFIETGKTKIIQYYDAQCSTILSQSESLLLRQDYEQSLALLMSVPVEVNCFASIQDRSLVVYQALQNQKCARQIQSAKAHMAAGKYSEVLDVLGTIDPAAACFADAQVLLKTIGDKISADEKKEWDVLMVRYKDATALEKIRVDAIKNIVVASGKTATFTEDTSSPITKNSPPVSTREVSSNVKHDSTAIKKKHRYYAFLMAVDQYQDPAIHSLDEPIKDAGLLKQVLTEKYTFEEGDIMFLKNPTYEDISVAFDDLTRRIEPSDFLLIFYAGHGFFDQQSNIGYWLPSDAQQKNHAKWFRNSALVENIRAINSKHTLLIADACFSGGIFKTRAPFDNASPDIADMMRHASRKAMTSGSLTTVPDKSVFMKYLVKILSENTNKYLPSEDLFDEIKRAMKTNAETKPLYGEIQNAGDEGGNFVLIHR